MSIKPDSDWQTHAYNVARRLVRRRRKPFLAEDVLTQVIDRVGEPHDRRSFGTVVRWLHSNGYIKAAGVGRARSSHHSLKPRWKAA